MKMISNIVRLFEKGIFKWKIDKVIIERVRGQPINLSFFIFYLKTPVPNKLTIGPDIAHWIGYVREIQIEGIIQWLWHFDVRFLSISCLLFGLPDYKFSQN